MWPRHTGDFSLFRIYADKNNRPAAYSPDNVPYTPKRSLKISLDGMKEGDFTMVFGFPGRTNEYLSSPAVRQIMEQSDPGEDRHTRQGFGNPERANEAGYANPHPVCSQIRQH